MIHKLKNLSLLTVVLPILACDRDDRTPSRSSVAASDPRVTAADTTQPRTNSSEERHIGRRLHVERLIAVPEVQLAMRRHVRMYQEGKVPREIAMARFRAWLELWVREHPDAAVRVAEASKIPEYARINPEDTARRVHVPVVRSKAQ